VATSMERDVGHAEKIQQRTKAAITKAMKEREAQHEINGKNEAQRKIDSMCDKQVQEAWENEARELQELKSSSQKSAQEIRGDFQTLGEQLSGAAGLGPAFGRLKAAQAQVSSAASTAAAGGERALRSSGDAPHAGGLGYRR